MLREPQIHHAAPVARFKQNLSGQMAPLLALAAPVANPEPF